MEDHVMLELIESISMLPTTRFLWEGEVTPVGYPCGELKSFCHLEDCDGSSPEGKPLLEPQ
jgi:hypothetical protein